MLNFVSFNIRCFGFNGDYFSPTPSESRVQFLKKFFAENFSDTDVFILQEIMDTSILAEILPEGFKFYHYTHEYPRHMHVVLCCKQKFNFQDTTTISGTALDDTKSRPAFYGKLYKGQAPIAHIIGAHLKSGYEDSQLRLKQGRAIGEFINTLNPKLPVVMAGDFNSHIKEKTGLPQDDLFFLKEIFQGSGLNLVSHKTWTYITAFEKASLDHFWTNAIVESTEVYDVESYSKNLQDYYDQISDHLPVKASLKKLIQI